MDASGNVYVGDTNNSVVRKAPNTSLYLACNSASDARRSFSISSRTFVSIFLLFSLSGGCSPPVTYTLFTRADRKTSEGRKSREDFRKFRGLAIGMGERRNPPLENEKCIYQRQFNDGRLIG